MKTLNISTQAGLTILAQAMGIIVVGSTDDSITVGTGTKVSKIEDFKDTAYKMFGIAVHSTWTDSRNIKLTAKELLKG